MTTATVTESFYLDRLKRSYLASYPYQFGVPEYRWWIGKKRFENMQEVNAVSINFHEETYAGFQLVIVEHHYQHRELFDSNGKPFVRSNHFDVTMIANRGDIYDDHEFYAYAYKIGHASDVNQDLAYTDQFAILQGICGSNSLAKTRKGALDKLKILAGVEAVNDQLISICDERFYQGSNTVNNPYNIVIGDQVFIHAHGRLRKGVVTATTGSRFVVGYVTPSNHYDLKYKIVRLGQTYVKETP